MTMATISPKVRGLNSNILKLIAVVTMTIDHTAIVFAEFFPDWLYVAMRAVGRLAYPLFAYFIAEGCRYTRNKLRYFLCIFLLAVICQVVYFFFDNSLYMCILVTFSLSIALIYALQFFIDSFKRSPLVIVLSALPFALGVCATYFLCTQVGTLFNLNRYGYGIDYGFIGMLVPVIVYLGKTKWTKLIAFAIANILLATTISIAMMDTSQLYCLLTVLLMLLYNGERGRIKMKYFFYIYYPLHLALLQGLYFLVMYF